jgi:hypothetical protein
MPFPRRSYRPGSRATGTFAHVVAASRPRVTQATPVSPGFFRRWPGRRRVALMSRGNQRLRILEEGFTGRCPPCLLDHRRVTRRSASLKLHKSLGHYASRPARRTGRETAEPRRITRTRPTSAPTNGWSKSSTSGIWLILVRWTGPGGASSPTISPPSRTEPGLSRSSRPPRPLRPRRGHQPRLHGRPRLRSSRRHRRPRQPSRPRQPRPPRRPRRKPPLSRAPLYLIPQLHPKVPRSAGCAAPRPAPSPT